MNSYSPFFATIRYVTGKLQNTKYFSLVFFNNLIFYHIYNIDSPPAK